MANDTMLNVRLDKTLKEHGCQVLERNGVSVSTLVRAAFEYLEQTQSLPSQLFDQQQSAGQRRRQLVRSMVGAYPVEPDFDFNEARQSHRASRLAKTEEGARA